MHIKITFLSLLCFYVQNVYSGALQLDSNNIDNVLANNDVVFINYYANWCRFSQMLQPIFDEFADQFATQFPNSKVVNGKVDCDAETAIATRFHVSKYPTLKIYRNGVMMKREYRGARTTEAFLNFMKEQMVDPIRRLESIHQINEINLSKKPAIIGYFEKDDSENYKSFQKLANILKESCDFVVALGEVSQGQRANGDNIVNKVLKAGVEEDISYTDSITNNDVLYAWANDRCTSLVREITFENAEELTEEGLPFLILFHKPDDVHNVEKFKDEVAKQLIHEKSSINAVFADGQKFSHPLHHLGKSVNDLPVLAIDSFRHMYLFPDFNKISENNLLRQFVLDLHSGKLHREFHNGPDPTVAPQIETESTDTVHIPKTNDEREEKPVKSSVPPESMFKKLQPSGDRYTFKDEF